MQAMRTAIGENAMMAYLAMMAVRLVEMHRVLKPTGSLYLHCDPTASHYLKLVLDAVFGPENFRTEIVWKRTFAHGNVGQELRRRHGQHFLLFEDHKLRLESAFPAGGGPERIAVKYPNTDPRRGAAGSRSRCAIRAFGRTFTIPTRHRTASPTGPTPMAGPAISSGCGNTAGKKAACIFPFARMFLCASA